MPLSDWVSPEVRRALLLALIVSSHYTWRQLLNHLVPDPYLDEVFHVPQAQAYWSSNFSHWDDKITTPPGLYFVSYGVNSVRAVFWAVADEKGEGGFQCNAADLRLTNLVLLYVLLLGMYAWAAIGRREINERNVLQREFVVLCFPLLWFFSGVYYTDVLSTVTVIVAYCFWAAGMEQEGEGWNWGRVACQVGHVVSGLAALATRQTNVFWVGVFLGGLQVVRTVKEGEEAEGVWDPLVGEAGVQDYLTTGVGIVRRAVRVIPRLVLDLWPQLSLLGAFAGFVVWNGGVVLGDKSNHVASVHLPQVLYFFAMVLFFSWPVLLPQLNASVSDLKAGLPRPVTCTGFTAIALAIIHFNTLVHPFTLADNRHYPFYVFRYFVIPFPRKYLFAPLYVACGWLAIQALSPVTTTPTARISTDTKKKANESRTIIFQRADTVHVSFVLVFLISTTLSLVTAPLVEPRYFLIPWLIWRLHVPEILESDAPKQKAIGGGKQQAQPGVVRRLVAMLARHASSIELIWHMVINVVTGYLFLFKPFEWEQEPGKLQRFMW